MKIRPKAMSDRQRWRVEKQAELVERRWPEAKRSGGRPFVVDLGCERGWSGYELRRRMPRARIIGVDLWQPYTLHCLELVLEGGAPVYDSVGEAEALSFLGSGACRPDVIIAGELLEHLGQADGIRLLEMMPACAELVILTTPFGYVPQGPIDHCPHQFHRSGWLPETLEAHGYVIDEIETVGGIETMLAHHGRLEP